MSNASSKFFLAALLVVSLFCVFYFGAQLLGKSSLRTAITLPAQRRSCIGFNTVSGISSEPSEWVYRSDRSREYVIKSCDLFRFSREEAHRELAGRHILFIGDSMTRYQYISLVYFLEYGSWPPRFQMDINCSHVDDLFQPTCSKYGKPSFLAESDWAKLWGPDDGWKRFYIALGGRSFNGRIDCQCSRNFTAARLGRTTENQFYQSESGIKVTYLQMFDNNLNGFKRSGCEKSGSCNLTDSEYDRLAEKLVTEGWDWVLPSDSPESYKYLRESVELEDVDFALINKGFWGGIPHNKSTATKQLRLLRELVKRNTSKIAQHGKKKGTSLVGRDGKCFWKGTSAPFRHFSVPKTKRNPQSFWALEEDLRVAATESGCEVFDVSHITSDFVTMKPPRIGTSAQDVYWDNLHFQPWVYEELNAVLLNTLISAI